MNGRMNNYLYYLGSKTKEIFTIMLCTIQFSPLFNGLSKECQIFLQNMKFYIENDW